MAYLLVRGNFAKLVKFEFNKVLSISLYPDMKHLKRRKKF